MGQLRKSPISSNSNTTKRRAILKWVTFSITIFLSLIRALFPRWSFFDETGFYYEIYFLLPDNTDWRRLEFRHTPQKIYHIFANPQFNQMLANWNIVEHFCRDIQESENIELSTCSSHKLLLTLLRIELKGYAKTHERVQFKILAFKSNAPEENTELVPIYKSPWVALE